MLRTPLRQAAIPRNGVVAVTQGLLRVLDRHEVAAVIAHELGHIKHRREFLADAAAARYTGTPLALASALGKIQAWSHEIPTRAGSPATAHLFIHNPFSGGGLARLFSTHPPVEERIARLEAMASGRMSTAA